MDDTVEFCENEIRRLTRIAEACREAGEADGENAALSQSRALQALLDRINAPRG